MPTEHLVAKLADLGLSEKQAAVYLAALELGPSPVQDIAKQAGINRVTGYPVVESLIALGLMSQYEEGKKTLYVAEEPKHLDLLIQREEEKVFRKRKQLEAIQEDLLKRRGMKGGRPLVRLYEGAEGLEMIRENYRRFHDTEVISLARRDLVYKLLARQPAMVGDRVNRGVRSRYMYGSVEGPTIPESSPELLRETRYVPIDKIPFEGEVAVMGDTTNLVSYAGNNLHGVVIESKAIADTMRVLMEYTWSFLSASNNRSESGKSPKNKDK